MVGLDALGGIDRKFGKSHALKFRFSGNTKDVNNLNELEQLLKERTNVSIIC